MTLLREHLSDASETVLRCQGVLVTLDCCNNSAIMVRQCQSHLSKPLKHATRRQSRLQKRLKHLVYLQSSSVTFFELLITFELMSVTFSKMFKTIDVLSVTCRGMLCSGYGLADVRDCVPRAGAVLFMYPMCLVALLNRFRLFVALVLSLCGFNIFQASID